MASSFFWYELMTTDMASAEAFYKKVVGWTSEPFGGSGMDYVVFNAGERSVAGMTPLPAEAKAMGAPPAWVGYIHVADVDVATASLNKAGGAIYRQPADIPGVGRFSVVADPQGAAFMLMKPMGPDQPPVPGMTPGHIGWRELYANEYKGAFDFYSGQFGWKKVRDHDMGEMGVYLIFDADGTEGIGGIMNRPPQVPVPCWLFYFTVPDIEAAAKRIGDHGGKVMFGPMQVPGGSWIVNAQDPQGVTFALVAAAK